NTFKGYGGIDDFHGAEGLDVVDYSSEAAAVTIDLGNGSDGAKQFGKAAGHTFESIEGIVGTNFADIVTGSADANKLTGLGGNDLLQGGDGNDVLSGGDGYDTLQ